MALSKATKMFLVPWDLDKMLIYDPASGSLEGIDVTSVATGEYKFSGICSLGGKIFLAPDSSDKMLIYDPASGSLEGIDVTSVATGENKFCGICSSGGKIFLAPLILDKMLIYDPASGSLEGIDVTSVATGACKFQGICSSGGKIFLAPARSDKMLIYDPASGSLEGIDVTSVATGEAKFCGICSSGGKIFLAPLNLDKMLIYDPASGSLEGIDVTSVATGENKFCGICSSGGKIFLAPLNSDKMLIYDPASGSLECIDVTSVATGEYKFSGICQIEDHMAPASAYPAAAPALAPISALAPALPPQLQPEVEDDISVIPTTKWEDLCPQHSLLEELRTNRRIRAKVPNIDTVADDIEVKVMELRFDRDSKELASPLDDDELGSIVGYTHDNGTGRKDGNFYYEENKDLRKRGVEDRIEMVLIWGIHVLYALRGLAKLPNFIGWVYRGNPDLEVAEEYTEGRPIQWGAWTSTTSSLAAAMAFGPGGIIFKIKVLTGKDISTLSFYKREGEILLTPNHRFIVTRGAYQEDGFTFIDLIEMKGKFFVS